MPLTVPQLDDRSFEQLLAEVKQRIPVHTPEWTNFNESDPGITLVELFAFMTENLLYRSNRIPEANRKKFLSLLGVPLIPAAPGRGMIYFRNERGPVKPWPVDAGLELQAGKVPFRTRTGVCVLPVTAEVFYKQPQSVLDDDARKRYQALYASLLNADSDQLKFYKSMALEAPATGKPLPVINLADNVTAGGTIDRSLWLALAGPKDVPIDTVRRAIAGQVLSIGISPALQCTGLTLEPAQYESKAVADPGLVFEIAAPDMNVKGKLAPPTYRRLVVEYAENVLEQPGIVQVILPEYSQLNLWPFDPEEEGTLDYPPLVEDKNLAKRIVTWIRVRLPLPEDPTAVNAGTQSALPGLLQEARLTWVGVNAARVLQSVPVQNERLGIASGAPDQVFKVANTPVYLETATGQPANFTVQVQNDSGGWDTWTRVEDLFAARASDMVYTLDPEAGEVRFGSGLRGLRPVLGRQVRASYEYGGGAAGNVGIGLINKSAALPGGYKVENPLATWGAGAGESAADGERNIPRYLRHRDRLITAVDFRDITLRTPGLDMGRAEILPLFHPERYKTNSGERVWPGIVTVLVIPKYDPDQPDAPRPDRLFLGTVCRWLEVRRLLTTEIFVRGPEYVPVIVSVGIVTQPGQVRELVQRAVQTAIRDYLSPLIGGPAVEGAATGTDEACVDPATPAPANACPTPRGTGWPLNMEVRRLDLEAVATRVGGRALCRLAAPGRDEGRRHADRHRARSHDRADAALAGRARRRREGDAEDLGALSAVWRPARRCAAEPGGGHSQVLQEMLAA